MRKTPAPAPLTWRANAQFVAILTRSDRTLAVVVQISPTGVGWTAAAIETIPAAAAASSDVVAAAELALSDHAHKMIGTYPGAADAIVAAESFARAWLRRHKSTRADQCGCDEIAPVDLSRYGIGGDNA